MKRENIYLSTMAPDAVRVAKEYGVNLEIAEYCTAWNMDEKFEGVDKVVQKENRGIAKVSFMLPTMKCLDEITGSHLCELQRWDFILDGRDCNQAGKVV